MHSERWKEPPIRRHPHEHDAPDDGRLDDLAYVAKLNHSGRPRKLSAAVLLLLLAMRQDHSGSAFGLRMVLIGPVQAVATQIARWLSVKLGVIVPVEQVAADLLNAIVEHAGKAMAQLSGNALAARLGLIVQAETQRATAAAVKRATRVHALPSLTRETTSDRPCDPCLSVAGTYSPPYPDDVWYSHPRCACQWYAS